MNRIRMFQIDAFAPSLYYGNPAGVCLLEQWLDEQTMQNIARENNLSETAFVVPNAGHYEIRWFTPKKEVDLCGHATLASAYALYLIGEQDHNNIHFHSKSGELVVKQKAPYLQMDFPALPYQKTTITDLISQATKNIVSEAYQSTFDLLCIVEDSEKVKNVQVDLNIISSLPYRGLILSAYHQKEGIYSRCFYPAYDVPEDPVTGSAHCVLAPFWCERLKKQRFYAKQGSARQGELWCEMEANRVLLTGQCQLYFQTEITI